MTKQDKIIYQILRGSSDRNIPFAQLISLMVKLGFEERIKGSHHIFYKKGIEEIINLQSDKNNMSKPYQVKQVRELIIRYKLAERI